MSFKFSDTFQPVQPLPQESTLNSLYLDSFNLNPTVPHFSPTPTTSQALWFGARSSTSFQAVNLNWRIEPNNILDMNKKNRFKTFVQVSYARSQYAVNRM